MVNQNTYCKENKSPPCGIIIFGASGDLTRRKLLPALFNLYKNNLLDNNFYILGTSRSNFSEHEFRNNVHNLLTKEYESAYGVTISEFVNHCHYIPGDYNDLEHYRRLSSVLNKLDKTYSTTGNRMLYCATPPSIYLHIISNLGKTGLTGSSGITSPWTRVIVEKPFGSDLNSSLELNQTLINTLQENQIYRIDHYLGKETVQNIIMFRFANAIFEPIWNNHYINHVQITASEEIGIGHRAGYFDRAGILRDMVQNHMFQLMTLVAMEPPAIFDAERVRDEKIKLIRSIRPFNKYFFCNDIIRGQYGQGIIDSQTVKAYQEEKGIIPSSQTETFIAMKLHIDNWRWQGVPFYIRAGKRLQKKITEIAIVFKKVHHSIFSPFELDTPQANVLFLTVQPKEGLSIKIQAKHPGGKACLTSVNMNFCYRDTFPVKLPDAYERLLLDCMQGDQTLFMRHDFMKYSWELLNPILENWYSDNPSCPLLKYKAGSWGPTESENLLLRDGRKWFYSKVE